MILIISKLNLRSLKSKLISLVRRFDRLQTFRLNFLWHLCSGEKVTLAVDIESEIELDRSDKSPMTERHESKLGLSPGWVAADKPTARVLGKFPTGMEAAVWARRNGGFFFAVVRLPAAPLVDGRFWPGLPAQLPSDCIMELRKLKVKSISAPSWATDKTDDNNWGKRCVAEQFEEVSQKCNLPPRLN